MFTYWIIFATAFSGLVHASWWFVAISAILLAGTLMFEDARTTGRLMAVQAIKLAFFAGLSRVSLSIAAATSAFLLGQTSAWIFGF